MMKEGPILMRGDMVLATLRAEQPKTQTRRKCQARTRAQIDIVAAAIQEDMLGADDGRHEREAWERIGCPYGGPGDRLWVRETACLAPKHFAAPDETCKQDDDGDWRYVSYRADGHSEEAMRDYKLKWTPSIHMPRWASRLLLEIVSVRLQRLQEISEADAWAEGCIRGEPWDNGKGWFPAERVVPGPKGHADGWDNARDWCLDLFAEINGGDPWNNNPFVWAIEFKRVEGVR